jgi:hypothetical protein
MIKYLNLTIFFLLLFAFNGFGQLGNDGTYLWNTTGITYAVNNKTELSLSNKDHYSFDIHRLDYYQFDLIGYRKLTSHFSLGLGYRLNETFKTEKWNRGGIYMFYGVYFASPGSLKIRFANRLAKRTSTIAATQYTFDNITNIDFFARSAGKWPKPYFMDEIFTNLKQRKVQTIRLYGGLHVFRFKTMGIDLFYCYQNTRPSGVWKDYNILGINTKFRI